MKLTSILIDGRSAPGRALRALVAAAILTLSVVNIYPTFAQTGSDGTGTNEGVYIDALFDFDVPVTVVSTGVFEGVSFSFGETSLDEDDYDEFDSSIERWTGQTSSEYFEEADFSNGSTNGLVVWDGWFLELDTNLWRGSSAAWSAPTNFGGADPIPTLPNVNFDLLSGVWSYLDADAPPEQSVIQQPLITDAIIGNFWLDSCNAGDILNADGGILYNYVSSIDTEAYPYLAWLYPAVTGVADKLQIFFRDNPLGFRPYMRFVAVVLYWIAMYRYLVKRVVFVVEVCFTSARQ